MNVSKKLVVLPILLMITLSMIGMAVAHWSEVIKINGLVEAGSLTVGFTKVTCVDKEYSEYPPILTLPDAELMLAEFTKEWGPGTLTSKTDVTGPGVQFNFTGLDPDSGTGVGDDFPVSCLAGGAEKTVLGWTHCNDFSAYDEYSLVFNNTGTNNVTVNIKINTGWTDPPWGTSQRDTFWQNTWTFLDVGETMILTLDFCCAEAWEADDDPVEAWRYPDGTPCVTVKRLDEVSEIGFQVLGYDEASIVVSAVPLTPGLPKDIGECTCWLDEYVKDEHTGKDGYRKVWVKITHGYPSYYCEAILHVTNLGTVPAHFKNITVETKTPGTEVVVKIPPPAKTAIWEIRNATTKEPILNIIFVNLVCIQLDVCDTTKAEMEIHIKQTAPECHTIEFDVEIEAENWDP